jgi:imidazolonepropionase-like amidohydrolase
VIENCAIATIDGPRHDQGGTEYRSGHVTVTGGRITAVGEGAAASVPAGAQRIDADGCLGTPPPRQALWLGTRGGARCLGRDDETGALRPGLLADIALWRLDGLAHDAIAHGPGGDPVAALVLGLPARLELLLVGGTPVVDGGELRTVDATTAVREVRAARQRLADPS